MRLIRAELRKLRRPLVLWTALAVVGVIGLFDWGLQKNAADQARFQLGGAPISPIPSCAQLGLPQGERCDRIREQQIRIFCATQDVPPGPACDRAIARQVAAQRRAEGPLRRELAEEFRSVKAIQHPLGGGILAGGMMASMVGATALLLLAGGHVGNEWSGRTIKQVLTQEGRRWRVLGAKVVSLWLAGVGLLVLVWLVLGAAGPALAAAYHVPASGASWTEVLRMSGGPMARSLLAMAAFATLGTLAAAITRNTLGAFFLGFAFVVASLILAGFRAVARYTLAYWVAGWMGFHGGAISVGPTYMWRDSFFPLADPSRMAGLVGLVAAIAVAAGVAVLRVHRSDVTV